MKIAVTYENGQVFQHFGHTAQFKLYQVEDGQVLSSQVVDTNGSGHGALAGFFAGPRAWTSLLCGGIGAAPKAALAQAASSCTARHRQRGPGCGGFAGGQAGLFAGRAVHPPRGGPRRRPLLRGARLRGTLLRQPRSIKRGGPKVLPFCLLLLPKGQQGETSPTQEMSSWCMARVQATYSRFLSKSVW